MVSSIFEGAKIIHFVHFLAKKKIFNESDRVKDFHGALSFTECLKEREIQIEHKKRYDGLRG